MKSMKAVRAALVAVMLVLVAGAAMAKNDAMSLVPADAVTVGVVHLDQLRTSPLAGALFQHTDKISADGDAQKFLSEAGLQPSKDVDTVVVATSAKTRFGKDAEVIVIAEGRFNVQRLTSALVARGATKKSASNVAYLVPPSSESDSHKGAIAFISGSLMLAGTEDAVIEALATRASGGSGFTTASLLGQDAARVDTKATAWAIVDVARASRLAGGARVPEGKGQAGDALAAALKTVSTVALWATDNGDSVKLGAFGLSGDTETLELLEDTIRGALSAMRLAVKDKSPELVSVLRRFEVARTADSISINGTIPADSLQKLMAKHTASK